MHHKQKAVAHIYKAAAGLQDLHYRSLLEETAGVTSMADPEMTDSGFDRVMAALETVLFQRVELGLVGNPIGKNRWIQKEYYWRQRLPRRGMINSRQFHTIQQLWKQLQEYLHGDDRSPIYLSGMVRKATGKKDIGMTALSIAEAACLIDALKDRLSYAIKTAKVPADLPF